MEGPKSAQTRFVGINYTSLCLLFSIIIHLTCSFSTLDLHMGDITGSGVYLHTAQQGVFPPPQKVLFLPLKIYKRLIKPWTNYVEVLLRCLYGNININLCFSFPHPPAKVANYFKFSHVSPTPKFLGQIKPCEK